MDLIPRFSIVGHEPDGGPPYQRLYHTMSPRPALFDSPVTSQTDISQLAGSQLTHVDERHPRNSLPHNRIDPAHIPKVERASTLPGSESTDGPILISPQDFVGISKGYLPKDLLLLDLRVFAQYAKSRIQGALNLCIPTTLLKRPSYNVQRLAETFTSRKEDRGKFVQWREVKVIVVYDSSSRTLPEATSCVNILKKFTNEDYRGATYILKGGFNSLLKKYPDQIDSRSSSEIDGSAPKKLSIDTPSSAPVAGGCAMPAAQNGANPFFGTIRQNMDLIDGVGQIPLKRPASFMDEERSAKLPKWLRDASDSKDKGKVVADRFLYIEKAEQKRMQKALTSVSWNTQHPISPSDVQMAGIEKGTKNRYKDILPFDHSRVKLQETSSDGCDYVNASHIESKRSSRQYIACQAPVPATFRDFWRVVWEQDARIIVMLTAESEGGQTKSHPYWIPGDYGPFKVQVLDDNSRSLDQPLHPKIQKSYTLPIGTPRSNGQPTPNRQHSTKPANSPSFFSPRLHSHPGGTPSAGNPSPSPSTSSQPSVAIRTLVLTHTDLPFTPIRQITQIHYSSWPDFGAPAHPKDLLALVELCHSFRKEVVKKPVVVHCSAGCGRTGTFCTVDTVLELVEKQQQGGKDKLGREKEHGKRDGNREEEEWIVDEEKDLIAETVAEFRLQRLSMVQTLRQFVLCYEAVMEAFAAKERGTDGKEELKRR